MKKYKVGIVGITGMVGRTLLKVLEERDFPVETLYGFASEKSQGQTLKFKDQDLTVEAISPQALNKDLDFLFFSAGTGVSQTYAPLAADKGITVIDNSAAFRMHPEIPLVIPEVNPQALDNHKNLIANPNCSTIQALVALKPLYDQYGIERIILSTYQAVSGSGVKGIEDLERGLEGQVSRQAYAHDISKNCIPHIDVFLDNGYTKEEMKMIEETKKIFNDPNLRVTATAVRVPITYAHSESINVELKSDFNLEDVHKLYKTSDHIIHTDDPKGNCYPLASQAQGTDQVYVGRIRRDFSLDRGLNLWVVADNMRKGAATNAIQIAETLIRDRR